MKNRTGISLILIFVLSSYIFPQESNSIQFYGGMVSPVNSQTGVSGIFQYNHQFGDKLSYYTYTGIFWWDRNNVHYLSSSANDAYWKKTYSEEDHFIIPVYAGIKYFFHNSSSFNPYFMAELGTGYFTYNSFNLLLNASADPEGTIIASQSNKTRKNDFFFGAGFGIGILHNLDSSFQFSMEIKITTIKSSQHNLFSSGGLLRSFQA